MPLHDVNPAEASGDPGQNEAGDEHKDGHRRYVVQDSGCRLLLDVDDAPRPVSELLRVEAAACVRIA